jgi:two-component system sensor histidine kinase/response regulator
LKIRSLIFMLMLLSLFTVVTGGSLYYTSLRAYSIHDAQNKAELQTITIQNRISAKVSQQIKGLRSLSGNVKIRNAMIQQNPASIRMAADSLSNFQDIFDLESCQLLDSRGEIIASSGLPVIGKSMGERLLDRPDFRQALLGRPVFYLPFGETSLERKIYFSHPVYLSASPLPEGVIVAKSVIDLEFTELGRTYPETWVMTDPYGIVFAGSQREWLYKVLWQLPKEKSEEIKQQAHFGQGPWGRLDFVRDPSGRVLAPDGTAYIFHESEIPDFPTWKIVYLARVDDILARMYDPVIGTSVYVTIVLLVFVALTVLVLYRKASTSIHQQSEMEAALRQQESRYRRIFDSATDGFVIFDPTGRIVEANHQSFRMFDMPRNRLIGKLWQDIVAPAHVHLFDRLRENVDNNIDTMVDAIGMRRDGGQFDIQVKAARFKYLGEAHILAITRDVSDQRRAECDLQESERQLVTLMGNLPGMVYRCHFDAQWTMVFVSEGSLELTGYHPADLVDNRGLSYNDVIHPEDRESVQEQVQAAHEKGRSFHLVYRIVDAKGNVKWVSEQGSFVSADPNGSVWIEGFITDINERKNAEDALRSSEEKFRTILENMEEGYYEVDIKGNLMFLNRSMSNILGYPSDELLGMNSRDYTDPENAERLYGAFNQVYRSGVPATGFDWQVIRKDGSRIYLESSVSLIQDAKGQTTGFRGITKDITERKRAEQELKEAKGKAESANLAKSQFLANMSHEIRTPMNGIIGFTEMLLDSDLEPGDLDIVATIKRSGETLLSLINDILDFSKVEAGELTFESIDFDPELLVYDICEMIKPRVGGKPVEIICHIDDDVPSLVQGDPLRVRQVITNLMGNASKFTETGEIEIRMVIQERHDDRFLMHTAVRDTGIGVPQDKIGLIFAPFQQVDGSTTRKYGGTGLGLSISHKIASQMGGDLWAESREGEGSTFHFSFWVKPSEEKKSTRRTPVALVGKRVLTVDDNRANREILEHVLNSAGMKVVSLDNGREVLPALTSAYEGGEPFDLFVGDIQMPGMSGYEVAEGIRSSGLPFASIPMIALSSMMERDAKRCALAGFDGFISKPLRRDRLFPMLRVVLVEKGEPKAAGDVSGPTISTQYSVRENIKHSVRILLAEDNIINQKLARMMLTKAGYEVEVVDNGRVAVERFESNPDDFDLIFMDVQMPEMDGMEATSVLREKGFGRIPIVAMTAHALPGDREKCIDAGMNDYITKPIKREIVFEMIDRWVLGKQAENGTAESPPSQ